MDQDFTRACKVHMQVLDPYTQGLLSRSQNFFVIIVVMLRCRMNIQSTTKKTTKMGNSKYMDSLDRVARGCYEWKLYVTGSKQCSYEIKTNEWQDDVKKWPPLEFPLLRIP